MSKGQVMVILDNVRSVYNVGAILRNLDCLGFNSIYLCGITAQPKLLPGSKNMKKTALAAYDNINWKYFKYSSTAIKNAKKLGYKVYIVEQSDNSKLLENQKFEFPIALVFGHEVEGVNEDLYKFADELIYLPNLGKSKSWNVSATASIVLWEAWKQLKKNRI